MPTAKQVRFHFGRISKLHHKLQRALNDAHNAKVISYDGRFTEEAPCWAHYECWLRVKKTTEKQLAQAMRDEIRKEII